MQCLKWQIWTWAYFSIYPLLLILLIPVLFDKGKRGETSYISNRYSKTNDRYLKSYDLKQESKHIKYLDRNNLYGYSKWLNG